MHKIIISVLLLISFAAIGQTSTNRYSLLTAEQITNLVHASANAASNSTVTINVRQYGAVPDDNIADDEAFKSAFAGGKSIFVPEGTFDFTNTIYATNIRTLSGVGSKSKLIFAANASGYLISGLSNTLDISNIQLNGNVPDGNYYTNKNLVGSKSGLLLWSVGDSDGISKIQNVSFANFSSNAITVIGDSDIYLRKNTALVSDNYITNCSIGIYVGKNNTGEYTTIARNTILGCNWGIKRYSPNIIISGNVIRECANGMLLGQSASGRGHGIVTGNIVNHIGTSAYLMTAPSAAIQVESVTSGLLIANNQMQGNGLSYIYLLNSSQILVTGNILEMGELKFGGGNTNYVTGNMMTDSPGVVNGITHNVSGNTDKTQVTGNYAAYGKFRFDDY